MRWRGRKQSSNVEDRRGSGGSINRRTAGGLGIGSVVVFALVLFFGGDLQDAFQASSQVSSSSPAPTQTSPGAAPNDEFGEFIGVVLQDTEDVWEKLFRESGSRYNKPRLVLLSGQTRSGCGIASSRTGPFYCPADQKVYIDPSFYSELKNRFGAPGDFALAYVVAHEVGHHIQHQLGYTRLVESEGRGRSQTYKNQLSVRLELQADFLAGVWAHHAQKMKNILEKGDVEEALNAASAIGDDRLMKQAQGYVVPDAFTHGSSAQRVRWFKAGIQSGRFDKETLDSFFQRESL